jgi:hypothetical protein
MEQVIDTNADRKIAEQHKDIPGWGMDADPKNDPTYPMKHWNGADHQRLNYPKAPQQTQDIEIFKSIERPTITRVFGTSTPPSGLSGNIRRFAFKYSESVPMHWMTLILADRVNVVEGIIEDLRKGIIPNIFAEKGWRAEWKYNKMGLIKKVATTVVISAAVIALLTHKKKKPGLLRKLKHA